MCTCDRRSAVSILAAAAASLASGTAARAQTVAGEIPVGRRRHFADEAERMR